MPTMNLIRLLVFMVFALSCSPVSAGPLGPTEQIRPTLDTLIGLLADTSLKGDAKKKERHEKIMDVISTRFDFREMSQRILGKTWNEIDEEQRDYFTKLMTQLLEKNYVGQLDSYSGETIEYTGEIIRENRAQVSTLVSNNNIKYPVYYILSMNTGTWMVYDINIEGVSLINNYRAEFNSILRKDKFAGLIKALEDKNRSME